MLSVTHIMPVLVLLSVVGVGMQQCMIQNKNELYKLSKVNNGRKYAANNKQFRPLFPYKIFLNISLNSNKIPDISLTAVKISDISRFSIQAVTMITMFRLHANFLWSPELGFQRSVYGNLG